MAAVTILMLLTICFVVASARVANIHSVKKRDTCPPMIDDEGIGERICEYDSDCPGQDECCPTNSGGTLCSGPVSDHLLSEKFDETPDDSISNIEGLGPSVPIDSEPIRRPNVDGFGPVRSDLSNGFKSAPMPILNGVGPFGLLTPLGFEPKVISPAKKMSLSISQYSLLFAAMPKDLPEFDNRVDSIPTSPIPIVPDSVREDVLEFDDRPNGDKTISSIPVRTDNEREDLAGLSYPSPVRRK